ncbi:hypothetical protein CGZ93_06020 [Enemella dayhoffiae]|uniref:Uncharacterized protein n=1 Tax=Enemella dayhoffiae TaxID=2016507 RepID=A0A255HA99_9ACTN|nr:hypothetical protein [Enemella dayhoffiae]OYO23494.1 hypothetical protein CGZ93_06020 [Enemella dayhoffiae]
MKNTIVWGTAVLTAALGALLIAPAAIAAPTATPTSSAAPRAEQLGVTLTAPTGPQDSVRISVTGVPKGDHIEVAGKPTGWTKEAPYYYERQNQAGGPMSLVIPAPSAGWPKGTAYNFTVTHNGRSVTRTFTLAGAPTTNPTEVGVDVTVPKSSTDAVIIRVSGVKSGNAAAEVRRAGSGSVLSGGGRTSADGTVTIRIEAPAGGWAPGAHYDVRVHANGTVATNGFSAPGKSSPNASGTVTPPSSADGPVVVRMKGVRPGAKVSVRVGLDGTEDLSSSAKGTVGADGTVTISVPAPKNGWQRGQKYAVVVDEEGQGDHIWMATFTFGGPGSTGGTASGSRPAKDKSGGLAKTGV